MKYFLLFFFIISTMYAQDSIHTKQDARIRVTYENIPLTDTRTMGTLGTHFDWYPLNSFPSLYTGLGFLNAIGGEEGGFFAFGYTAGIDYELISKFHIDTGIYVGGGSGRYISFDNGGMIIRSHTAFAYQLKGVDLVLGVDRTDFPNSTTNQEHQTDIHPYFGVNISNDIWSEPSPHIFGNDSIAAFDGMFQKLRITPSILYYDVDNKIVKKERYTGDAAYQANFPALGMQFDKFLTDEAFVSFEAYGALASAAGYAAIQAGVGYDYKILDYLKWESKLVVGSSGDSRIDTGGGFIVQPLTGTVIELSPGFSLKTLVGRTYAPTGLFSSTTYEVGLSFNTNNPVPKEGRYLFDIAKVSKLKWYMKPSVKVYFPYSSTHKSSESESKKTISLLGITMGIPFSEYFNLTGSTHWAMTGNIGSYAEGLFGLQAFSPSFTSLHIHAKAGVEIGAGAGAGVNTSSGGFVTQLSTGFEFPITKSTSFNAEIGQMHTSDGKFKAISSLIGIRIDLTYLSLK